MATVAMREPLLNRVSWGSLFAGFFFGFAIWMLMLSLGAGIGFAAFDPRDMQNWQGLGIGFGIWGVLSGIVSMFVAGWFTARLSEADSKPHGMLHGAALWGFMLVAGLWLATMAVTRTAGAAASAVGTAAQAGGQAAAGNPELQREARQQTGQVQAQAEQLKQQAVEHKEEAAGAAKTAGATGAWAFFIYGLLTLVAAMLGGRAGVPKERLVVHRDTTSTVPPLTPSPHRA